MRLWPRREVLIRLGVFLLILAAAAGIVAFYYWQPDWANPKGFGQGFIEASPHTGLRQRQALRSEEEQQAQEELGRSAPVPPPPEVRVEVGPRPDEEPPAPSGLPSPPAEQ
jgi:hypothetical protein